MTITQLIGELTAFLADNGDIPVKLKISAYQVVADVEKAEVILIDVDGVMVPDYLELTDMAAELAEAEAETPMGDIE